MHDLTGFQRDVLFVLAGLDDPKGLAVRNELQEYYEGEVHHSRLYPNLDALVEKGLVEKERSDGRANAYALTRRGRRVIADRQEWERRYFEEDQERRPA